MANEHISITIKGPVAYVPKWDTLQQIINEALNCDGRFTRIARQDGWPDYRKPAIYKLTYSPYVMGAELDITVTVER